MYDYNMVVIGGGSAGLVSSYIAAAVKAKVLLVEKHKMGGDCLNTGCVPSKALIRAATLYQEMKHAERLGIKAESLTVDVEGVMRHVHESIDTIAPHDSVERYQSLGVDCITGEARIVSPYAIEVNGKTITARSIIVATGARPLVPQIPGLEKVEYLTSDSLWSLRILPKKLVVLGGGAIGVEMAQSFARLGAEVTLIERSSRIMVREDNEVSQHITQVLASEGVHILTDHQVTSFDKETLVCTHNGENVVIPFDRVILALGRTPNVSGFGLEELGVTIDERGRVASSPYLQTNIPSIYVCGDVTGSYQFTHTASHEAWYASVNALFAPFWRFKVDYRVIPWVTFSDPEVARVGLNEQEAKHQAIPHEVTYYDISGLDRAIAEKKAQGFVKVLTKPKKDQILGVTILGPHAGDILAEFVLAMKHGIGMNKILSTIHSYPTFAEANKFAAGEWKKAHVPALALRLLERFHQWRK